MMKKHNFTFYMDILGMILIFIPFLIAILLSINFSLNEHAFIIDYLIPAELSFIVMPGALMIMLVALKNKYFFKTKAILFSLALISLLLIMILPNLVGFGHDASLAQGFWYILTFVSLGIYEIAVLALALFTIIKL